MYFENKDIDYDGPEWNKPLEFQIYKLKEEKKRLEEYIRHLLFINKILVHTFSHSHCYFSKRKTFTLDLNKNDYYIIEALNILLNDVPSRSSNVFSIEEVKNYINRIDNEISCAEDRIDNIISQLNEYRKEK